MNVVDSSGWLEYFANGENASFFAPAIDDTEHLIVPVICIYEVFKRLLQQRGADTALSNINDMHEGQIINLDATLALNAAQISTENKLAMADSLILATARKFQATLWTQDEHFKDMDGVRYIGKD